MRRHEELNRRELVFAVNRQAEIGNGDMTRRIRGVDSEEILTGRGRRS